MYLQMSKPVGVTGECSSSSSGPGTAEAGRGAYPASSFASIRSTGRGGAGREEPPLTGTKHEATGGGVEHQGADDSPKRAGRGWNKRTRYRRGCRPLGSGSPWVHF